MKTVTHEFDFVVIGGGLSGLCAALTAARSGVRTALVQDRPVLGGNASKEIRVPPVGATGCNYLYCRETGIIEEIQLTNLLLNPFGSHEQWDLLLQSLVYEQRNLTCFLDTVVQSVTTDRSDGGLETVTGYTLGAELYQVFNAPYFADCTGDGTVAVLAGAQYRIGKEAGSEFGESMAPEEARHGGMGMSIQFRARDIGRPADFVKPGWVDLDIDHESFGPFRDVCGGFLNDHGGFWWLEWGGNLDTVHETPQAKRQILAIVYGVWDYLKNRSEISGRILNFELDWVGSIPGKRESRRIVGDHILNQGEIERSEPFEDAVAFGGWGFDDHPGDGFLAEHEASYHVKHASPYNIPLRSLYSRDVPNLFLAGRDISVTHIGLSSTRVMLTCAQLGEAVGAAAAQCRKMGVMPRELVENGEAILLLQRALGRADHHIHGMSPIDSEDLAPSARVSSSSTLSSPVLEESEGTIGLDGDLLWQFPAATERLTEVQILLDVARRTEIGYAIYEGAENGNTYPGRRLNQGEIMVEPGDRKWVTLPAPVVVERIGWHYVELKANPNIRAHWGKTPPVGLAGFVIRPEDPIRPNPYSRWSQFERNAFTRTAFCFRISPPQPVYDAACVTDGHSRPWRLPHLWSSAPTDFSTAEWIRLSWDSPKSISRVLILFDSSLDFTFYQSWQGYPDTVIPSLVTEYELEVSDDGNLWKTIASIRGNFLRRRSHEFDEVTCRHLRLRMDAVRGWPRAQVYSVRVFR